VEIREFDEKVWQMRQLVQILTISIFSLVLFLWLGKCRFPIFRYWIWV